LAYLPDMHKRNFVPLYSTLNASILEMPVVRCNSFDALLWQYVVDNARLRKISRCEALQRIVQEHMRLVALKYQEVEVRKDTKKVQKK
jgi:hypothetical protein